MIRKSQKKLLEYINNSAPRDEIDALLAGGSPKVEELNRKHINP